LRGRRGRRRWLRDVSHTVHTLKAEEKIDVGGRELLQAEHPVDKIEHVLGKPPADQVALS